MRSAADFNAFYATPDPWMISRARFREKMLRRSLADIVSGKSVLDLGCGEGFVAQAIFGNAKSIKGIDISTVAIERANARNLPNATFESGEFLDVPFDGYDVVSAMDVLFYLSIEERTAFFEKVAREHRNGLLIISGPIVGDGEHRRYFTNDELRAEFDRYRFELVRYNNIVVNRRTLVTNVLAMAARLPLIGPVILDALPDSMTFHRVYVLHTASTLAQLPIFNRTR